jgi:hypothetical protein
VLEDGVERVSLSEFIQKDFDRDTLLPELHVSDKLVSLTVVHETEIVTIFLFNHELSLSFFTSMSSNFNKFSWLSDSKWDVKFSKRFLKCFLVGKLSDDTGEVRHSDGLWLSSYGSVGFEHWVRNEKGRLNL